MRLRLEFRHVRGSRERACASSFECDLTRVGVLLSGPATERSRRIMVGHRPIAAATIRPPIRGTIVAAHDQRIRPARRPPESAAQFACAW